MVSSNARGVSSVGQTVLYLLRHAFLFLWAAISLFPFLWMLSSMTNSQADISRGRILPGTSLISNLTDFFSRMDGTVVLYNSFKIAILSMVLTVAISSAAGYAFEMFRTRKSDRLYASLLLTMMLPGAATTIPLFIMLAKAGLLNTHAAIIVPGIASVFIIFYFRQCTKGFPSELRDAARVDGLKEWQIFLFIYIPVMRSSYATALIILFMGAWGSFMWPLIVLHSDNLKPIMLVISVLTTAYYPDYGVIMVGTVFATLPTLILFFAMQRHFFHGIVGAVNKGEK